MYYMKCNMMKQILALLSWGLICIPKEPEAFTFAKMEVGHPVELLHFPKLISVKSKWQKIAEFPHHCEFFYYILRTF